LGASDSCGADLSDCLGGRIPPTRFEGDPTATVFRGIAQGEYRPVRHVTFALGARGQYSPDPLFAFEEFAAGNYTIGRGYDPGAAVGDSSFALQAELRFGSLAARSDRTFAFQPFVFIDSAWVWNEDRLFSVEDEHIMSVGGGLRAMWGQRARLDLLVAFPLERTAFQPDRDPRILLSITTRLLPWNLP